MEKNENIEMITGDPKKAINKLSLPIIASMFLIFANNIIDSIWVAGLGAEPLAALGYITPLFMIIVGFGNGLGAGGNSLISRYIGAEDKASANNAATIYFQIQFRKAYSIHCINCSWQHQRFGAYTWR